MGLRFRKSISLCKGVRLNIGKTGVSISAGIPGFRKTIHSSGKVTTSVGIPGTGIYYVDTKNPAKDKPAPSKKTQSQISAYTWRPTPKLAIQPAPTHMSTTANLHRGDSCNQQAPVVDNCTAVGNSASTQPAAPAIKPSVKEIISIPDAVFPSSKVTELFESCDYPVKWIDVLTNAQPPDSAFNLDTWEYLHSKAVDVFEGDVEAMLEIIERINPYDDLLDYLTDFEIEAEDAECIEITCRIIRNSIGAEKEDAAASLIIRLARDTFALLPVPSVRIHMLNAPSSIIDDVYFERDVFADTIFENKDPSELLTSLCRS